MKIALPLLLLIHLSCKSNHESFSKITHKDARIHYIGRTIEYMDKTELSYSYSSVEFTIKGDTALILIEDMGKGGEQHTNYLQVEINGTVDSIIELVQQKRWYNLSSLLKKQTNSIKLFKRTEASVGTIAFYNLKLGLNDTLLNNNEKYHHKILWVGNSLTCGYGNELNIPAPPKGNPSTGFHAKNENSYYAWGSITSRFFQAESHQICYSGKGVYRNFDDSRTETMPQIFNRTFPNANFKTWNHKKFQPELIVINLSTNDFGQEMVNPNNRCDSLLFVENYTLFVNELLDNYPKSEIILVIGNALTDNWPANLMRLTRSRNYIHSTANNCKTPGRVTCFELKTQNEPYGEDWHPTINTHLQMSSEITVFIKKHMNW